jgi:hypothetical protein
MTVKLNVENIFFDYVTVDEVENAAELEKKGMWHCSRNRNSYVSVKKKLNVDISSISS